MSGRIIAVSGHRHLPPGAPAWIRRHVEELVAHYPACTWKTGGAVGVDQTVARELLALGQKVELILPFKPDIVGQRWSSQLRAQLDELIERVNVVEVIRDRYHVEGYRERNRRLLEGASLLVAFWTGAPGGTAVTVRAARQKGLFTVCLWGERSLEDELFF